jgi:hypothetical protein
MLHWLSTLTEPSSMSQAVRLLLPFNNSAFDFFVLVFPPVPFNLIASSPDYLVLFLCTDCGFYSKDGAGRKCQLKHSKQLCSYWFFQQFTESPSLVSLSLSVLTLTWSSPNWRLVAFHQLIWSIMTSQTAKFAKCNRGHLVELRMVEEIE